MSGSAYDTAVLYIAMSLQLFEKFHTSQDQSKRYWWHISAVNQLDINLNCDHQEEERKEEETDLQEEQKRFGFDCARMVLYCEDRHNKA